MTQRQKYLIAYAILFTLGLGIVWGASVVLIAQYLLTGSIPGSAYATIAAGFLLIIISLIGREVLKANKQDIR